MRGASERALRIGRHAARIDVERIGTRVDPAPTGDAFRRSSHARAGRWSEREESEGKPTAARGPPPGSERHADPDPNWTYEAPLATSLKRVKVLSIASCGLTLAGAPLLVTLGHSDAMWYAKASIGTTLAAFGTFTTWLLHWFSHPYVHRLEHDPRTDACEAKQLNVFGLAKTTTFFVSDASIPSTGRPFVSFVARGRCYYVDRAAFGNEPLYRRLVREGEDNRPPVKGADVPSAS